jgi:cell wall assembly regulator SMI1
MTTAVAIIVFGVLGAVAIRHLVRTFYYPAPTRSAPTVNEDIDAALARFEAALRTHAPNVLDQLRPGLTDEEIARIERAYRLRLTDELRALYRWRDGSPPDPLVEFIPGHRFRPLEEAAKERIELPRQAAGSSFVAWAAFIIVAGHRMGWLHVFDDLCGDGYFHDPRRRRRGALFYHFAEVHDYRYFPTLANFLVGAAECYETGIYQVGRRGRTSEDHERASELWAAYASTPRG